MRYKWILVSFFIICFSIGLIWKYPTYCFSLFGSCYFVGEPIIRLSVSQDGRYVISSDNKGWITLWDIQQKTKKILDKKGNIYSADWIKGTDFFYWQSWDTNEVHVRDTAGKRIKDFNSGELSFGSAMTPDLKYYAQGSSVSEGCYYFVMNLDSGRAPYHPKDYMKDYVICGPNPYHFIFLSNKYLFVSNATISMRTVDDGWTIGVKRGWLAYRGLQGTLFATISPDGKYVIGGDEGTVNLVWETKTGKQILHLYDPDFGKLERTTADDKSPYLMKDMNVYNKWIPEVLHVRMPKDFYNDLPYWGVLASLFIDKDHYLMIKRGTHYAILYTTLDPSPLKYLELGKSPIAAVTDFDRDLANDSSWQAHIFAIAKQDEGGILVYRYDPEKQTLTRIWDAR